MDCVRAVGGLLCHVAGVAGVGRDVVFVQGEGVEGLSVRGAGLGAVVEYPDNLQWSC